MRHAIKKAPRPYKFVGFFTCDTGLNILEMVLINDGICTNVMENTTKYENTMEYETLIV